MYATDTIYTSSHNDAVKYINSIKGLHKSSFWPNINPELFLKNIRDDINTPLDLYQGSNTNFCGYAALSYLPLNYDPLGHALKLVTLFEKGEVQYGEELLKPSAAVRKAAGNLKYKGGLDIRPAEQMWFLSLADHFKSYLNFFNKNYDPGDENKFWAAVSYGKFNRMIKKLFGYHVHARGSDLMHPKVGDIYTYLQEQLKKDGITIVFQNNAYLRKKNTGKLKPGFPTHFIVLLDIKKYENDLIDILYWDYGFRTLRQVNPAILKKIVFGISFISKKNSVHD
ncbi:MAG: hypothetical protein ABIY51_12765 [Ferruginibacter sp.]